MFLKNYQNKLVYETLYPHPRSGKITNPMRIKNPTGFDIPKFSSTSQSFSDITDKRASEIKQIVEQEDLPITVFWSGGIDSTLVLSAIIKNWDIELKRRVVIKLNNSSYAENPYFFDRQIREHFRYTNGPIHYRNSFCLSGNVADSIWVQADLLELTSNYPRSLIRDLRTEPDDLLNWFRFKTDREHAEWLYQTILENASESGIELMDYEDFYWWMNFNFYYSGQHFKLLKQMQTNPFKDGDWEKFQSHNLTWFHNDEYQLWSMNNRSNGVKYDGTVRSYKMPAKQYIFDVDGNQWYRDYKTKTGSVLLRPEFTKTQQMFLVGLYENGEAIFSKF